MSANLSDPVDVLARTLWGEARGEGTHGMEAVACVVRNRAEHPRWWGQDIISVCRAPWQFSAWNNDDLNLPQLLAVTIQDRQFVQARDIANRTVRGTLPDITKRADHFHTIAARPVWSRGRTPVSIIGNHRFFRLVIPPPPRL